MRTQKDYKRTLFLRDVVEDFQIGLVVQKGQKSLVWVDLVDIGIRVPSVECFFERYEIHRMRQMGFLNPEPAIWLTFWRSTFSSLDLEEPKLQADAILREFVKFCDPIVADADRFRSEMLDLLNEARRPAWATASAATQLINKALVARTLRDPETDACAHVDELIKNEPNIQGYEDEIESFCQWLRSARSESGAA